MKVGETPVYKSYKFVVKEVKEKERIVIARVSKQAVDLDNEVIMLDGMKFRERIPFLWSHLHHELPVGEIKSITKIEDDLIAEIYYAKPESNPKAENLYNLTLEGLVNEFSIGAMPDYSTITFKGDVRYINNCELFEVSAVNFGANPHTSVLAKALDVGLSKGIITEKEKTEIELMLDSKKEEDELQEMVKYLDTKEEDELDLILKDLDINRSEKNSEQIINKMLCKDCGSDLICPICNHIHKSQDEFEWVLKDLESPNPNKEETLEDLLKQL